MADNAANSLPAYGDANLLKSVVLHPEMTEEQRAERSQLLYPMMAPKQPFRFDAWVSMDSAREFWHKMNSGRFDLIGEPTWWSGDYDLLFEIDPKHNRQVNLTLPLVDDLALMLTQNKTAYLHF